MHDSPLRDTAVGIFVLAGLAALAYLSVSLGGAAYRGQGGLIILATFDEIGGLKERAPVVVGGVKIGQVTKIQLDEDFRAEVTLDLDEKYPIPSDSAASIMTAGLLGDKYISLEPGSEEASLKTGDQIEFTYSAIILERLIGKLVQNLGVKGKE